MPTYKNETDKRISWAGKGYITWFPDQEYKLDYFVPYELLGLTVTDPEPYVLRGKPRNIGYHEMTIIPGAPIADRTYNLPYWETIQLSVSVIQSFLECADPAEGEEQEQILSLDLVRMYIGDSDIPIVVEVHNNHVNHYPWDMCAYLVFESDAEVDVIIKASPYTSRGTETRSS